MLNLHIMNTLFAKLQHAKIRKIRNSWYLPCSSFFIIIFGKHRENVPFTLIIVRFLGITPTILTSHHVKHINKTSIPNFSIKGTIFANLHYFKHKFKIQQIDVYRGQMSCFIICCNISWRTFFANQLFKKWTQLEKKRKQNIFYNSHSKRQTN